MKYRSEELSEIFKALSKAQGSMKSAKKDRNGHGYKYADLAECIETAKTVLASNGLSVSQMMSGDDDENRTLITILAHESGQYFGSEFVMAKAVLSGGSGKNPAQVLGSAITYMRRYSYAAIIGMAQDDDDGASCGRQTNQPNQKQTSKNNNSHPTNNTSKQKRYKATEWIDKIAEGGSESLVANWEKYKDKVLEGLDEEDKNYVLNIHKQYQKMFKE